MTLSKDFLKADSRLCAETWLSKLSSAKHFEVLDQFLQNVSECEVKPGQVLWEQSSQVPGIFIVVSGKVRLVNSQNKLLVSLDANQSFGECSLFPTLQVSPYIARASLNLKVIKVSKTAIEQIFKRKLELLDALRQRAIAFDLFCLCHSFAECTDLSSDKVVQHIKNIKRYDLNSGEAPPIQESAIWIVRSGELRHSEGHHLHRGDRYILESASENKRWQAVQPTELYTCHPKDWPCSPQAQSTKQTSVRIQYNSTSSAIVDRDRASLSTPSRPKRNRFKKASFPAPTLRIQHWWQHAIRRYPFFAQQSASDCGAACLVMVGRYWGKRFSLNRLRDLTNVDRNGASLRGLASAAESIGFTTRPVKASLDRLARQTLPAIVHWEGKHFTVVYEVTRRKVVLADPAIGQRTLSYSEFKQGWTGYALLVHPNVLFKQSEESTQTFWQFFDLIKPHRLILFEIFITSVLIQIFGLVTPLLTQLLLDRVVVQRSELTLTTVGLGMLLFGGFRIAMTGLRQYLLDHTANRVDLSMIVGFINHTFRLPLNFFENRYVGDIISRVQENRKIQRFLTGEALSILLDLLTVFIYIGLIFWYSWKMALLTLVVIPPFIILALSVTPFLQKISRQIFNAYTEETGYLIQALTGIRSVKSMALENTVRWHWEDLFGQSIKTNFSGQLIGNTLQIIAAVIEMILTTILLWFGAWLVIQNELTIGQLVAFNMLLGNVINPFKRLTLLWNELQEVLIAVERIKDVIDTDPEEDLHDQYRQIIPAIRGHIQLLQVTFRYHPNSDLNTLENVSFEVLPGQMVAVVGRSGSGKSTLAKLLLGLYVPTDGKILIDGYDLSGVALQSFRQDIGVVDQDTFLFGGTIRENITMTSPNSTLDEVIDAATLAGAHDFIQELPKGYETLIGEGGGMLSGGQRQRLAIARALVGDPRLLILDEATSHLDAESERIIQKNLQQILHDRTTLVIAHRLSTVRKADLILVMDRGMIVEKGTHEQLVQKQGHYFYLNQQQLMFTE